MKKDGIIPDGMRAASFTFEGNKMTIFFEPEKYVPKVGDCVKLKYGNKESYAYCLISKTNGREIASKNTWIDEYWNISRVKFEDFGSSQYSSIEKITPEEFQAEFEKLGYVYDFETHTAHKKRWRANRGCEYFFFSSLLEVHTDIDIYASLDNKRYNIGNYFKTKEDAEAKVNEIKKLLKQ